MAIQAFGHNYFRDTGYPITVKRVDSTLPESHAHDLTETMHYHDFSELIIITGGTGAHWIEGDEYLVRVGDVFLVQGDQKHFFSKRTNLTLCNVMFREDKLPLPLKEFQGMPGYQAVFVLEPEYRKQHGFGSHLRLHGEGLGVVTGIVQSMMEELSQQDPGFEAALLMRLIELIVTLSRQYPGLGPSSGGRSLLRLARVIARMEKDLARDWKLSDLAEEANMSPGNLNRVFRQSTGVSPVEYLIRLRLKVAMERLTGTSFPITQIAFEVGFNDSNYFTRCFKRFIGVTPFQYRKRHTPRQIS